MQIGSKVRVRNINDDNKRISTIAIIYENNNTFDLTDEDNVDIKRISKLEDFELENVIIFNALNEKENGNKLFSLKDYNAAINRYKRSLILLDEMNKISIGCEVLVESIDDYQNYRSAIISDIINNNFYDLIYDESFDNNDNNDNDNNNKNLQNEESNVSHLRIYNIASPLLSLSTANNTDNTLNIQKAVLMNIAKCYFQTNKYGLAIKYISIYLAIINLIEHNNDNVIIEDEKKKKSDALWIKAKCFLQSGRPNISKKIVKKLSKYDKQRSDSLIIEIEKFILKRNKENKHLAKEIATWVDHAMNINEKNKCNDDIYIKDDIVDNDNIDENTNKDNEKCFIS